MLSHAQDSTAPKGLAKPRARKAVRMHSPVRTRSPDMLIARGRNSSQAVDRPGASEDSSSAPAPAQDNDGYVMLLVQQHAMQMQGTLPACRCDLRMLRWSKDGEAPTLPVAKQLLAVLQ